MKEGICYYWSMTLKCPLSDGTCLLSTNLALVLCPSIRKGLIWWEQGCNSLPMQGTKLIKKPRPVLCLVFFDQWDFSWSLFLTNVLGGGEIWRNYYGENVGIPLHYIHCLHDLTQITTVWWKHSIYRISPTQVCGTMNIYKKTENSYM